MPKIRKANGRSPVGMLSRAAWPVHLALLLFPVWTGAVLSAAVPLSAEAQSIEQLKQLSIEQLGDVEITSVSKEPERLKSAAASVYVIGHDDIIRSGATTIPEMLRLAPNLYVAQISPSQYVITARGLSGNFADQNFSNKLLVLVDGRSVYSPLFSGVFWDTVDMPPEDIERIEVISGPGGTLWGANAVNGVINIITREAADTQGGFLDVGIGNLEAAAGLQYGGKLDEDVAYRIYGKMFAERAFDSAPGTSAHDGWYKPQGGFRLDWTPQNDTVVLEGNYYYGAEDQPGASSAPVEGRNFEAQWQHLLSDGSSLQVLAYYDQTRRSIQGGGEGFSLDTYDLEVQHNFDWGNWNSIVWGAGERFSPYTIVDRISSGSSLLFVPSSRTLNLADIFGQDRMSLSDTLDLVLGLKLEDDPWSGWSPMPTVRANWKIGTDTLLWAAVSRTIRSPTPFDTDVVEKLGSITFVAGNPDFLPERLWAYELGYKGNILDRVSLSVAGYFDQYDHLRSLEFSPGGTFPLLWGNTMEGNIYGVEVWANYEINDWWRLSPAITLQTESLRFAPGASGLLGIAQAGDDPHHQASVRSSMNLTDSITFDADFRYVGTLPDPHVPQYVEANARIGWKVSDRFEVSLSGYNLLHAHHEEFTTPPADQIRRSFFVDTRWKL